MTQPNPKATAPKDAPAEEPSKKVVYSGPAGVREISTADWKRAGVEDQKTVTWDESNGYAVPVDQLNVEALEVLKRDRHLNVK